MNRIFSNDFYVSLNFKKEKTIPVYHTLKGFYGNDKYSNLESKYYIDR